ncbi:apyrase [Marchantia polymorpha subsp. ruderalis]|nr:hypothetical protein MARPO_0002s0232 [Marchantia polymorpha]BBN00106.1 hypothetical protein Mp_1g26460 [Marchantia polymorpha subsp. ruderalis]|eukprot:PTQ49778.1 hypothetical protein MARPO_0002s0232 [Marchantia polymorpha]
MRGARQESLGEKLYRYRGVLFVVSIPIALISFVLLLMPRSLDDASIAGLDNFEPGPGKILMEPGSTKRWSIVFDAGSSGSRVHVFAFDTSMDLIPFEDGSMEIFLQSKPGLSNYSGRPEEAAKSLNVLLDPALEAVPRSSWSETPVLLGATAGLRLLPGENSENILEQVRSLLGNTGLKFKDEWVSILNGAKEGTYQWVTVNYLLGNLGKSFDKTVGVVDLGGGSVQMSYAISEETAKTAPKPQSGVDSYVVKLNLLGQTYYLYVYSYLRYGLQAVRGEILKLVKKTDTCPCIPEGFDGTYKYGSESWRAVAGPDGADVAKCKELALEALRKDDACTSMQCTFGGVWSGGGGAGRKKLLVASFFFDKALEAGIITDPKASQATIKPSNFQKAAAKACKKNVDDVQSTYGLSASDAPYFCMDLVYEYLLLVEGFGIDANEEITLVKQVSYQGGLVEAAWPLGMAIESLSS